MKNTAKPASKPEPTTYRADRGDLLTLPEIEAVLHKHIMNMNKGCNFAGSVDDSTPKHLRAAETKGYIERMFARLNLHQESPHEDSK